MSRRTILGLALLLAALSGPAAAKPGDRAGDSPLGALGGGGKEPIKIDADRLDVFDRESKAVFAGNVVAVQGDSTIRCSAMTVHYKRGKDAKEKDAKDPKDKDTKDKDTKQAGAGGEEAEPKGAARDPGSMGENGIRKVECAGPVTVVQKDQVATGDNAVFDQTARRIVLTGNVVLSQCQNVTRGSRLVYDMGTGRANMDPVAGGRVSAMFVPGEKADAKGGSKGGSGCASPPGIAARGTDKGADKGGADKGGTDKGAPGAAKARAQAN